MKVILLEIHIVAFLIFLFTTFEQFFKNIFYDTRADRRAFAAIGCVIVFVIGVHCIMYTLGEDSDGGSGEDQLAAVFGSEDIYDGNSETGGDVPSFFDPNTVDSVSLAAFGIEGYKIRNMMRYRAAGKVFRSAEDMGRTYGWTGADVEKVKDYVMIANNGWKDTEYGNGGEGESGRRMGESGRTKDGWNRSRDGRHYSDGNGGAVEGTMRHNSDMNVDNASGGRDGRGDSDAGIAGSSRGGRYVKFDHLVVVNVNEADSMTLCSIPGIGSGVSRAIIKFRDDLGGVYDKKQLLEIEIVSEDMLEWMDVGRNVKLRTLNINRASFSVLNRHPYISYEQAKALVGYMRLYGRIGDERVLMATGIFSADEIRKLRPYLRYE